MYLATISNPLVASSSGWKLHGLGHCIVYCSTVTMGSVNSNRSLLVSVFQKKEKHGESFESGYMTALLEYFDLSVLG